MSKFGRFLAISFMCHQRPERSFFYKGRQFPICARCTGILIGYFVGILLMFFIDINYCGFGIVLAVPMIVDGVIQHKLRKESTNVRRLITGILGGISIICIILSIHLFTVELAKKFLEFIH